MARILEFITAYFFVFPVVVVLVLPILTVAAAYWHRRREELDQEELERQAEALRRVDASHPQEPEGSNRTPGMR